MGLFDSLRRLFGSRKPAPTGTKDSSSIQSDLKQSQPNQPAGADVFTPEQTAIGEEAKRLFRELSVLMNSELDGLSRAQELETLKKCRYSFSALDAFIAKHGKLIDWTDRQEILKQLDRAEIELQPLHAASSPSHKLICVIDTETTGLDQRDEPVSVAVVLLEIEPIKGKLIREVDAYHGLREPNVPIHPKAQAVHGMSLEHLRGASFDMQKLRKIVDSADIFVAHNAPFDRRMISKIVPGLMQAKWVCSINSLRWLWKEVSPKGASLDAICELLEVDRPSPHDAMADCRALIEVLSTHTGVTEKSKTYFASAISSRWEMPAS